MSNVVQQLAAQMNANRTARREFFGEEMGAAVADAVAKMNAAVAADDAAVIARDNEDAKSDLKYSTEKELMAKQISEAIADLRDNENVGEYADDMAELRKLVMADESSATAQLAEYVSAETAKTNKLIEDFGTLEAVEAAFEGFLGGAAS